MTPHCGKVKGFCRDAAVEARGPFVAPAERPAWVQCRSMGWRDWVRGGSPEPTEAGSGAVRRIAAELDALPPDQARYLAAFAYLLGRVAHADRQVSAAETARMEELVRESAALSADQATLVVEIAKGQNRLFGHVENFLVTRELREGATVEQRRALLDCLFSVSAAEDGISGEEEAQVRQIASELGFSHPEYVEARAAWSAHRNVLRGLPGR
jgi:uncharacterized tellurite resistance protein B-like protein